MLTSYSMQRSTGSKPPVVGDSTVGIVVTTPSSRSCTGCCTNFCCSICAKPLRRRFGAICRMKGKLSVWHVHVSFNYNTTCSNRCTIPGGLGWWILLAEIELTCGRNLFLTIPLKYSAKYRAR